MSDLDLANPSLEDATPNEGPSRRSARAVPRPNFRALENADDDEVEELSSEGEEDLASQHRKRKGGKSSKSSSSARHRIKKPPAVDDLEASVKEAEAEVAALVPQAQAWKDRYVSLVAENEALKQRILDLSNELVKRGGVAPGGVVAGAETGIGDPSIAAPTALPGTFEAYPQLHVAQLQAPSPTPPLGFEIPPPS